jgi:protein-S-isoprenylcysteine O-methyltransferase Ste14
VRPLARFGARLAVALARRRVPLGFLLGAVVLWLAQPTWESLVRGGVFALAGEVLRFWAAGHLEKSKEVTRSGPYAYMRHPLYLGSAIIAVGVAIAGENRIASLLIALYLGTTLPAAVLAEERHLREKFGPEYDAYALKQAPPMERRFSMTRAIRNREHQTIAGIIAGFALLALKAAL